MHASPEHLSAAGGLPSGGLAGGLTSPMLMHGHPGVMAPPNPQAGAPVAAAEKASLGAAGASFPAHKTKKVLIVDDTQDIRTIIAETLSLYGFNTLVAEDGTRGIRLALQERPDLIICDINMPNLDGYGTLTALRENDATATIPFIFLSGASDKINMRRGMELGADDYLTKPFTHQELMAAVNTRLNRQSEWQRQSDKKLEELRGSITLALPHELRTPLNGILGLAGLLMDDFATMPRPEILDNARFIQESALRLHRLIENFLVYSQLQLMASTGRRIDEFSNLPTLAVEEIVPEVAQRLAQKYNRPNDLQLEVSPCPLLIPHEDLTKIVEELIDNAFKFSEPGQPVRVAAAGTSGQVVFTITDHGRGLTPEQISKIGPHMQFDRNIYEQQGAGLGLFIAKRLSELLGGQFGIESKPGLETTARVTFPSAGL